MKQLFVLLALAMAASAAVPPQIYYQGYLTSTDGTPLDTVVTMTFRLYDAPAGGTCPWTETQPACTVRAGHFNVVLGSGQGINFPIIAWNNLWLGVTLGTDAEMAPRSQLLSSPYSYKVQTIDGAWGGALSGSVQSDSLIL